MARIIEKQYEKEIKCGNCHALIGYGSSDIKTIIVYPPTGYYKLGEEKYEPISIHFLICPCCNKNILLNKRCKNGLGN